MTNVEWLRRFCARITAAGYPAGRVAELVERSEVDELREGARQDPEAAADDELARWSD